MAKAYFGPGSTGAAPPPGYGGFNVGQPTAYKIDPRTGQKIVDCSQPFSGTLSQPGLPGGAPGGTWNPGAAGGPAGAPQGLFPWSAGGSGGGGYGGVPGAGMVGGGGGGMGGPGSYGAVSQGQLGSLLPANPTAQDIQGMNAAGLAFQEYERLPGLYNPNGLAGGIEGQIRAQLTGQDSSFTPETMNRMRAQIGSQSGAADAARRRMIGDSAASSGITGAAQLGMQQQSQEEAARQNAGQVNALEIQASQQRFQDRVQGAQMGQNWLGSQASAMTPSILAKGQALSGFQNFGQGDPGLGGGGGLGGFQKQSSVGYGSPFGAQLSGMSSNAFGALGGNQGGLAQQQPADPFRSAMERLAAMGYGGSYAQQARPVSMPSTPGASPASQYAPGGQYAQGQSPPNLTPDQLRQLAGMGQGAFDAYQAGLDFRSFR